MVSSNNLIIAGLALLAGFFVLRGSSLASVPAVNGADIQEEIIDPEIGILQKLLSDARSLFKNTFKDPIKPKGLCCDRFGKELPCRGPNCLGNQGAAGVIAQFDPFTGLRTVVGFGPRGSLKTQAFFGDISQNAPRIAAGNILKGDLNDFIIELQNQLKIKQTNTV